MIEIERVEEVGNQNNQGVEEVRTEGKNTAAGTLQSLIKEDKERPA